MTLLVVDVVVVVVAIFATVVVITVVVTVVTIVVTTIVCVVRDPGNLPGHDRFRGRQPDHLQSVD